MIPFNAFLGHVYCRRKHGDPVRINHTSKLINTGMEKEITNTYRCPVCGREWKETQYV